MCRYINNSRYNLMLFVTFRLEEHSPLDVALMVQKIFIPISSMCFGLLGGVALLQLLLVTIYISFSLCNISKMIKIPRHTVLRLWGCLTILQYLFKSHGFFVMCIILKSTLKTFILKLSKCHRKYALKVIIQLVKDHQLTTNRSFPQAQS